MFYCVFFLVFLFGRFGTPKFVWEWDLVEVRWYVTCFFSPCFVAVKSSSFAASLPTSNMEQWQVGRIQKHFGTKFGARDDSGYRQLLSIT